MILSIEFLQDIPIPQRGTMTSRKFFASDGWLITPLYDGRVRLRPRNGSFSSTVFNVPYLLHEDGREPDAAPALPDLSPNQAAELAVEQHFGVTFVDVAHDPTPKKPLKKGKRA
ncbi:MAG: hypothetical protein KF894_08950 [Labilithrix sp.]|nr:hypothetical protein [Labilithrix sp.]